MFAFQDVAIPGTLANLKKKADKQVLLELVDGPHYKNLLFGSLGWNGKLTLKMETSCY